MSDMREQAKRLTEAVEKLTHEAERLRNDTRRLAGRIHPFDEEVKIEIPSHLREFRPKPIRSFVDAFAIIRSARDTIVGAEHHLASARANIDAIANDVTSREEFKQWIIDPAPRKRER